MSSYQALAAVFAVFAGAAVVMGIVGVAYYIVSSIFIMRVCDKCEVNNSWLAWIPFARFYVLAKASDDHTETIKIFNSFEVKREIFVFWFILAIVLPLIPAIGSICSYIIQVGCLGASCQYIYAKMEHKSISDTFGIGLASGFIPLIAVIKFIGYNSNLKDPDFKPEFGGEVVD